MPGVRVLRAQVRSHSSISSTSIRPLRTCSVSRRATRSTEWSPPGSCRARRRSEGMRNRLSLLLLVVLASVALPSAASALEIRTDYEWLQGPECVDGWSNADFDDSHW